MKSILQRADGSEREADVPLGALYVEESVVVAPAKVPADYDLLRIPPISLYVKTT